MIIRYIHKNINAILALLLILAIFMLGFCAGGLITAIIYGMTETEAVTDFENEPQQIDILQHEQPPIVNLGEFKITAYCACFDCCGKTDGVTATGTKATQGRTIAVDPRVIPYGTEIIIDGHKYVAEDCGGAIKGNRIDVFYETHAAAMLYGVQYCEVYALA